MDKGQNSNDLFSVEELLSACEEAGTNFAAVIRNQPTPQGRDSLLDPNKRRIDLMAVKEEKSPKTPQKDDYCGRAVKITDIHGTPKVPKNRPRVALKFGECSEEELMYQQQVVKPDDIANYVSPVKIDVMESYPEMQERHLNEFQMTGPEYCGDLESSVKRNRRVRRELWQSTKNYEKRLRGEEYQGYKFHPSLVGKTIRVTRPARKMKDPCTSTECRKRKNRYCDKFSELDRNALFCQFWKEMTDWGQRKAFVISMVDQHKAKRTLVPNSRKVESFHYFLKLHNRKREVCKKMFMNTLSIGPKQLYNWITAKNLNPKRRNTKKHEPSEKKLTAIEFLTEIPKLPSHYCRKDSKKLYVEPSFTSKRELYRCYRDQKCHGKNFVSWFTFSRLLEEMNISLFQPKKDKCDICCSHDAGNITMEEKEDHQKKYKAAREEKERDKVHAQANEFHVLAMDLQAVHVSPVLTASALYYKTKLLVHNFTVYDLVTRDATCYLWDESQGDLSASMFATCVIDFLGKYTDNLPIIIWSDGCTSQNRNAMLSTALLDHAMKTRKIIIQKFLEKGHTQMEVDSVHSAIERKMKGKSLMCLRIIYQFAKKLVLTQDRMK